VLALMIFALLGADYYFNDWRASTFLGRKFIDLTVYLKFWR